RVRSYRYEHSLRPCLGTTIAPRERAPFRRSLLALRGHVLDDADQVALRIRELAEGDHAHDLLGAHDARAAEALGLLQRLLDVGHRDVEGDVALVPVRPLADAAADAEVAVGRLVVARRDHPVLELVVRVDVPAEELAVVVDELVAVPADDLEVHDRVTHLGLLSL